MRLVSWPAATTLLVLGGSHARVAPPDACAVLTAAQVGAALGTTVTANTGLAPSACSWAPPDAPLIGGKRAYLAVMTPEQFATDKSALGGAGVKETPVSGLGDEAIMYVGKGGDPPMLEVRKGRSGCQIRVGGFETAQAQQIEQTLAKEALAKL